MLASQREILQTGLDSLLIPVLDSLGDVHPHDICAAIAQTDDTTPIAIASLLAFVQVNWTGPSLPDPLLNALSRFNQHRLTILDYLIVDGEYPFHGIRHPILLHLARVVSETVSSDPVRAYWSAKSAYIHQQTLDNPSQSLHALIMAHLGTVKSSVENDSASDEERAEYNLFRGLACQLFHETKAAKSHFEEAKKSTGFEFNVTGSLGRRTRFQQDDIAQLVIDVKSSRMMDPVDDNSTDLNRHNLTHNDDTLLEKVEFKDKKDGEKQTLPLIDQCTLLAFCMDVKNTNPVDGLTTEQIQPFISFLTHVKPHNYTIFTTALFYRSRLDASKSRTVERGVLQLQTLIDNFDNDEDGSAEHRLAYFWSCPVVSWWSMYRECGERYMSLGALRSALEIFQKVEMWEQAVQCYIAMDESEKAEKIIMEQLEKTPLSPVFHCLLGDIRQDPELWERAWDLSQHRYTRAMRTLARYHFKQGDFANAAECFRKALAVNSLFEGAWFTLGCASMHIEDWEEAQRAFMRCVALDSDNGEAWNNLSAVYIKPDALKCLKEGLKHQFDNWKMWENYLFVSLDTEEYSESMNAINRLLSLEWGKKPSRIDIDALDALVRGVLNVHKSIEKSDADAQQSLNRMYVRLVSLMESVTAISSTNPDIWKLNAIMYSCISEPEKAIEAHLSAYRSLNQSTVGEDVEHSREAFERLAKVAIDTAEALQNAQDEGVLKDGYYQARLILRSLVKRTKDNFESDPLHEKMTEMLANVAEVGR